MPNAVLLTDQYFIKVVLTIMRGKQRRKKMENFIWHRESYQSFSLKVERWSEWPPVVPFSPKSLSFNISLIKKPYKLLRDCFKQLAKCYTDVTSSTVYSFQINKLVLTSLSVVIMKELTNQSILHVTYHQVQCNGLRPGLEFMWNGVVSVTLDCITNYLWKKMA